MFQSNISKTDPIKINELAQEENSPNHTEVVNYNNANDHNGSNDSNDSPWSTKGYLMGARTIYPPPAQDDSPIIPVLPRRREGEMEEGECVNHQLFREMQNSEDDQEAVEAEDLSDRDDFDQEPQELRSAVFIGRNYSEFSQAALAGYRYRMR